MAKEAKAEPEKIAPAVQAVTDVADQMDDEELDAKFGAKQAITADPLEKIVDAKLSRPEPKRPSEDDLKLDPCDWVKSHFNRIAQKDVGAIVERDEWNHGLLRVEIRGRPGSISVGHIDELRRTRSLDVISKAMQAFLGGFLPEYRLDE